MMSVNYAVAPGEYLREWMDEQGCSRERVAVLLGWTPRDVDVFLSGRALMTPNIASALERVVGIPVDSWRRYDLAYRAAVRRLRS